MKELIILNGRRKRTGNNYNTIIVTKNGSGYAIARERERSDCEDRNRVGGEDGYCTCLIEESHSSLPNITYDELSECCKEGYRSFDIVGLR